VTHEPGQHFFGYYDKCPWDPSGRYLLAMEAEAPDRMPTPEDRLHLGVIDLQGRGRFEPFATTRAWCWQQGTMLQWVPNQPHRTVVFNDRREGAFVGVALDLESGRERVLPRPIYALSRDGRQAVGLNFARLNDVRPGYGYAGLTDPWAAVDAPADDGVYHIDLVRGTAALAASYAQVVAVAHTTDMDGNKTWFNHCQFSTDDGRVFFLHRWDVPGRPRQHRGFTMNPDGANLRLAWDTRYISHFDWRSPHEILAWTETARGARGYYVADERSGAARAVGMGVLTEDGHCSYRPGGGWIVNDTYPDARHLRTLLLHRERDDLRLDLARFLSPPELEGPLRCDLHPRWNRDGTQICIDSAHEGSRQMYLVDVSTPLTSADRV
ncbi:MAG: hypothetical protein FJ029_12910, partial [Actinobacteria bacterium]|nr:hypothetical protein [Actinomycetota bacterium]